jgi:hypothetical protein
MNLRRHVMNGTRRQHERGTEACGGDRRGEAGPSEGARPAAAEGGRRGVRGIVRRANRR